MFTPSDVLGDENHIGARDRVDDLLARQKIQCEGVIDPVFRRKLREFAPSIQCIWNHVVRRWVFYYRHPGRTGLGASQFWHDASNWHSGEPNRVRRNLMRAALAFDIQKRSMGLVPIMEHGPEEGPLDERIILMLALGDNADRPGVRQLYDRVTAEAKRRVSTSSSLDMVDYSLATKTLQSDGSPFKDHIDVDARAKKYRDDLRSDVGASPVPFTAPAVEPPVSVQVK